MQAILDAIKRVGAKRLVIDTDKGVVVIHPRRTDYVGMVTGIPQRSGPRKAQEQEAAPEPKAIK